MQKAPVETGIRELEEILDKYLNADSSINYAIKIVGHPGIGKSSIVRQVAENRNFHFIDTRLAFKENIDLGGYPVPDHDRKRMIYYRPRFIPPETVPDNRDGILWFLDEANRAHPTVIQTLFQIITEHTCGEHALPEKTAIVLAGNLGDSDSTTITEFDDSALDGRLAIFHLKPSAEDWLAWASQSGIHPSVIRYVSMYPEKLWDEMNINPNPRGWHQVSQALKLSWKLGTEEALYAGLTETPDSPLEKIIASLVGDVTAFDFANQVRSPRKITTEQILAGDEKRLHAMRGGEVPSEDILWALSGAISHIRNKAIEKSGNFNSGDLTELGNTLLFISSSRSDTRMSFFYMLLKECGLLTKIPAAAGKIQSDSDRAEVKNKFRLFLEG